MKTLQIKGQSRADLGKKSTKKLRNESCVPCVLYGHKAQNINFSVAEKDLRDLIYSPNSHVVEIEIDGKVNPCILKDIQFHPVSDKILHIDFTNVDESKPITIDVPVHVTGNADGVKQGGKLHLVRRKLKISALLKDLPDNLSVDVTPLKLGKSISVGELSFDNVNILNPKTDIVVTVKMTRAATLTDETAEAAATDAAAAPAAGAAPAADSKAPAAPAADDKAKKSK